jgi:hypothetical protein
MNVNIERKLEKIDTLKRELDRLRPLEDDQVRNLKT